VERIDPDVPQFRDHTRACRSSAFRRGGRCYRPRSCPDHTRCQLRRLRSWNEYHRHKVSSTSMNRMRREVTR
jgi:hypothetical protein